MATALLGLVEAARRGWNADLMLDPTIKEPGFVINFRLNELQKSEDPKDKELMLKYAQANVRFFLSLPPAPHSSLALEDSSKVGPESETSTKPLSSLLVLPSHGGQYELLKRSDVTHRPLYRDAHRHIYLHQQQISYGPVRMSLWSPWRRSPKLTVDQTSPYS